MRVCARRTYWAPKRLWPACAACVLGLFTATLLAGPAAAGPVGLRVVGGTPVAAAASFPYQVAVYVQGPAGTLEFCGGVIIDPIQILTAAHCVTDETSGAAVAPGLVSVLVGTAMLPLGVPASPVGASIAVEQQYDHRTADYDIAVVTLSAPLYVGSPRADGFTSVAPIPLITPALAAQFADPNASPAEPVIISGWGETRPLAVGQPGSAANLPQQLQAVGTHLVPDAVCAGQYAALASLGLPQPTPRTLCAGEPAGGVDACAGDSGGPLVSDIDSPAAPPGDYVLTGLIDFGAGCGQPGFPGVYVRIATPEITAFIATQVQAAGQQLTSPPTPVGVPAPHRGLAAGGTASLAVSSGRVRNRVARVAVRCANATCTGTLTLRTTTTVGVAHFAIAANSTAAIPVRITPRGQRQLDRSGHRLRTRATLRTTGAATAHLSFSITD